MSEPAAGHRHPAVVAGGLLGVVAIAIGFGAWSLLRSRHLGEPELAHRVLIISAPDSDLRHALTPAGFDVDQETWARHAQDSWSRQPGVGLDALVDEADERGYGFLALVFDHDAPWDPAALVSDAPADASAVVIGIGDLRERDAAPVLRFGAPVPGIEMSDSLRAHVGLRVALYDHPDLVRLWADPTPDQQSQQVQLGALTESRVLLHARLTRQRNAAASWPTAPPTPERMTAPWVSFTGLPVANGVLFQQATLALTCDESLVPTVDHQQGEPMWLASADFGHPERARAVAVGELSDLQLSPNREFLAAFDGEREVRRWTATGASGLRELDPVTLLAPAYKLAVSNTGAIVGRMGPTLSTVDAGFSLGLDAYTARFAWLGDQLIVVETDQRVVILDARPPSTRAPDEGLRALSFELEALLPEATGGDARIEALSASADALFVLIDAHDGDERGYLVELRIDPIALRASGHDQPTAAALAATSVTAEQLRAGVAGVELRVLGQLPPARALFVANDGASVGWWASDAVGTLQIAALTGAGVGEPRSYAELGANDSWSRSRWPHFGADSRAVLVPEGLVHALGEASALRWYPLPR